MSQKTRRPLRLAVILAALVGAVLAGATNATAAPAQMGPSASQQAGLIHLAGGKYHKRKYKRAGRVHARQAERHVRHKHRKYHKRSYEHKSHRHTDRERYVIIHRDRGYDRKPYKRVTRYAIGHRFPRHNGIHLRHPHHHGLAHPARGYGWYRLGSDVYLIALGTGLIVQALAY